MEVAGSDIVLVDRTKGEITFRTASTPAAIGEVVTFKGVAFSVEEVMLDESTDPPQQVARAQVSRIEELGDVEPFAMTVNEGDVIVLMAEQALTAERTLQMKSRAERIFPGHTVIVLDSGLRIGKVASA